MSDDKVISRLRGYMNQFENEPSDNFKILIVINILTFLQEKDWFNKRFKHIIGIRKILKVKIKEFNEIIQKSNSKFHVNLINLFHKNLNYS